MVPHNIMIDCLQSANWSHHKDALNHDSVNRCTRVSHVFAMRSIIPCLLSSCCYSAPTLRSQWASGTIIEYDWIEHPSEGKKPRSLSNVATFLVHQRCVWTTVSHIVLRFWWWYVICSRVCSCGLSWMCCWSARSCDPWHLARLWSVELYRSGCKWLTLRYKCMPIILVVMQM